jgi:hypothetical protein
LSRICPIHFVGLHTDDIVFICVFCHGLLESLGGLIVSASKNI